MHRSNRHYDERDVAFLKKQNTFRRLCVLVGVAIFTGELMASLLWTPLLGPWSQERQGIANLRQAAQERQILVAQAKGELQAAQAQADAIRTMGESARAYPEYQTQLFVQAFSEALENGSIGQIIYVPVETGLPITESDKP